MRGIFNIQKKKILILCKTYPSPSRNHVETSCVAGVTEENQFIRLFPIPFRLLSPSSQFKKWQWVELKCHKSDKDHRPESHSIDITSIKCIGKPIPSSNAWSERRKIISQLQKFQSFEEIENNRKNHKNTLALLTGIRLIKLEIQPAKTPYWTPEQEKILRQAETRTDLFVTQERQLMNPLEKLPYDFYYHYVCEKTGKTFKHKIVDWEIGAAYRSWKKSYGDGWEIPFRKKFEEDFAQKDLMFLMGTMHRFPSQWLIISLIYPPKNKDDNLLLSC